MARGLNGYIESRHQAYMDSDLPRTGSGSRLVTGRAYWLYVGATFEAVRLLHVVCQATTKGAGSQTAEVCVASTPEPPNGASQQLTKIVASGTLSSLTVDGVCKNTTPFDYDMPDTLTHLWCGIRTAMGSNEPIFVSHGFDMNFGKVFQTVAAGALTGAGPWTGALVPDYELQQCPVLRLVTGPIP